MLNIKHLGASLSAIKNDFRRIELDDHALSPFYGNRYR
jgi:hypothetical protein